MAETRKAVAKKTAASTKTKGSPKKAKRSRKKKNVAEPITLVTDQNRPDDSSATFGNPAVVDGIEGYVVSAVSYDSKTGYPEEVLFRPRDNGNSLTTVKYSDVQALRDGYR
jgi:hypothetical protein